MRAWLVVATLVGTASYAEAIPPPPPPRPTIDRLCTGPLSESDLAACVKRVAPSSTITTWSKDIRLVRSDPARDPSAFVFVRFGNAWRWGSWISDTNHELVSETWQQLGGFPTLRIEVGRVVSMRANQWMRQRLLLVCSERGPSRRNACSVDTIACTVMQGGRAIEAFHAVVTIDDKTGAAVVTGDRSKAGVNCGGRVSRR